MESKVCIACAEMKPLSEFYKHARMADGYLKRCKSCQKQIVLEDRNRNRQRYSDYERQRNQRPERRRQQREYEKRSHVRDPQKYVARYTLTNAIRDGRIVKKPCEFCGNPKSQGHHYDYSKPLDVQWVCFQMPP